MKDVIKMRKKNHGWKPHIKETINVTSVYANLYLEDAYERLETLSKYNKDLFLKEFARLRKINRQMLRQLKQKGKNLENLKTQLLKELKR